MVHDTEASSLSSIQVMHELAPGCPCISITVGSASCLINQPKAYIISHGQQQIILGQCVQPIFLSSLVMVNPSGYVSRTIIFSRLSATARNFFNHCLQLFLFPVNVTIQIAFLLILSWCSCWWIGKPCFPLLQCVARLLNQIY